MLGSALVGQPPATPNDRLIYKALFIVSPSALNPDKKYPLGPPAPASAVYQTRSPSLIIGTSFAIAIAALLTGARLMVRARRKSFALDDWVIIPGALGCIIYLSLDIVSESAGCLGKHLYECTYAELGRFVETAHINYPIFYFTVFCIKISIVLQNRRITGIASRNWQIAHYTYLALLLCLLPICVFLNIFTCSPIATTFSLQAIAQVADPRDMKCLNQQALSLATRTVHIVTDWLLLPVPLIILYRLQMPWRKKLRIGLIFCLGLISSVATIMRNVLITQVTTDLTWDYYSIYTWDIVDIFFATVVASLPALNALADTIFDRIKTLTLGSKSSDSSNRNMNVKLPSFQRRINAFHRPTVMSGNPSKQSEDSLDPIVFGQADIELASTSAERVNSEIVGLKCDSATTSAVLR